MAKRNQTPPKSFEDAIQELEQILADIEGGELGLEESLAKYERGNVLIQYCRTVLNTAERQIELLSKGPDGGLVSAPLRITGAEGGAEGEPEAAGGDSADAEDESEPTDE